MKTKKMISLIMALAMMFSLAVSAFATSPTPTATPNPNEFTTTATVKVPAINVTVPTSSPLFINPLGFQVVISGDNAGKAASGDEEAYQVTKNQIVSPVFQIKNASPMKLKVLVAGTAVVATTTPAAPSNFKVVNPSTEEGNVGKLAFAADSTANDVYIYATFDKVSGEGEEATLKDAEYAYVAEANGTSPTKYQPTYGLAKPGSNGKMPDPTAVGEINPAVDGEPTIMGFKFQGACNPNAAKDFEAGWAVDVKMIFTFKPIA